MKTKLMRCAQSTKIAGVVASITKPATMARTYLQPHYGNGVFGNVYLLALDNTNR